uniref:Uncharacterized protein n=1 Tax=Arundo donax TaxID=35708 RepID=A0A0A9Q985_ARUDO
MVIRHMVVQIKAPGRLPSPLPEGAVVLYVPSI